MRKNAGNKGTREHKRYIVEDFNRKVRIMIGVKLVPSLFLWGETMKLEHEVLLYLCPPIGGLSIVDHALGAGSPERLVKWLRATVKRKEAQGEEIPAEVVNWIVAIDLIGSVLADERVRESLCEWRKRMARVNSHNKCELDVLTDAEWATVGDWLSYVGELEA